MRKRRFPTGVEATEADFNALHDRTEDAIRVLLRALASANADGDTILFKHAEPTILGAGPWTVTVPPQFFSINGVVAELAQQTVAVSAASNRQVALFLRARRFNVTESRGYLDLTGERPARGVGAFVMELADSAELAVVDPYTGSGDDPAPTASDVGAPLKFAVLTVSGVGGTPELDVTDYDPDARLWLFPAATPPTDHAATHLTGGGDAIALATPLVDGLAAADDIATVRASLTDLSVHVDAPFLVRTISGDNETTPKTATLNLRLSQALRTLDDGGTKRLDLNFLNGTTAGTALRPARADHKHTLADSPVVVATRFVEITAPDGELGGSRTLVFPESFGSIVSVSARWLAPGITAPYYPLVDAPWGTVFLNGIARRVGARYTVSGANRIELQLATDALCEMTDSEMALVLAATGSVNWDTVVGSNGTLPRTGRLVVTAVGVRSGLTIPQ